MNVIYAILSIVGWAWCVVAAVFLILRRGRAQ
jgi:hypothetical protein